MARAPVRVTFIRMAAEFMNEARGEATPTGAEATPTDAADASGGIPPRCASERMMMITAEMHRFIKTLGFNHSQLLLVITCLLISCIL